MERATTPICSGAGGGQATIDDSAGAGDVLLFDASIKSADLALAQSGDGANLIFSVADSADRVTITNAWGSGRIEHVRFAEGTEWSTQDIVTRLGTPANSVIYGDGNDTIHAGPGVHFVHASNDNNVIVFNAGDGQQVISNIQRPFVHSIIQIGGYTKDEIAFSRRAIDSTDFLITFKNSADRIVLEDSVYANYYTGLSSIQLLADGTSLNLDDIRAAIGTQQASTAGNGTLDPVGFGAVALAKGNDLIIGAQNDTYLYHKGDGDDRIVPYQGSGSSSLLKLVDYNASDLASALRASAIGSDLVLTFKTAGDRLTITNVLSGYNGFSFYFSLQFADGTVWNRDAMRQAVVGFSDTIGNDTVDGRFGYALTYAAKPGDDDMIGAGNGDIFVFARGHGHDTIDESNGGGVANIARFTDIKSTDVSVAWAYKGSSTVVLTYNGDTADSVTILNGLAPDARGIGTFQFADGVTWDKAKLRSLLSNAPPVATDDGLFFRRFRPGADDRPSRAARQ